MKALAGLAAHVEEGTGLQGIFGGGLAYDGCGALCQDGSVVGAVAAGSWVVNVGSYNWQGPSSYSKFLLGLYIRHK